MHAKRQLKFIFLFCLLSMFGLNACFLFTRSATRPTTTQSIPTLVAQTVDAQSTLSSGYTAVAQLTQLAANVTPTGTPTTAIASPTSISPTVTANHPTVTPFSPTWIPIPPIYPTPFPAPPMPPPVPCNWVQYVKDVSIPDGSVLSPGEEFTKIWRLRNIGSCSWTPYFSLVFAGGDRMQGRSFSPLQEVVYPGESVDVAVELVAPIEAGRYRGYWMLSDLYGQSFGIGESAQTAFWVDIKVESHIRVEYDFVANMCDASWRNGGQHLPCPGDEYDPRGSVVLIENPTLETGKRENQPALWMRPQQSHDGMITGTFTTYQVHPGDRFMADIGCLIDSPGCDVIFSLDYQIMGQPVKNLGTWREVYDGKLTRLVVDLTSLESNYVQFILRVNNKGKPYEANAFWLAPSIQRSPPIP